MIAQNFIAHDDVKKKLLGDMRDSHLFWGVV